MAGANDDKVRATTRVPARLEVVMKRGEDRVSGLVIDLSAGGAGIRAVGIPDEGDTVAIKIVMPDGYVIDTKAEVMHAGDREPQRCGLRFQRLDPTSLFAIHAYVARGGVPAMIV